jgi:hypothetical protein
MSRDEIYKTAAALAAIAVVVFAAVAMSASQLRIALVAICLIALAWRRLERTPLFDPVQVVAVVVLLATLAWIVIADSGNEGKENRSAPEPQHEATPGKVIHVYNKVTSGSHRMGEDDKKVFLTTKPVGFCSERDCNIPGTRRETGDTYDAAVCQLEGEEEITNGNDINKLDDHNPHVFDSRRYYGVRLDDNTFGYVSEVWIYPRDRGGLGLPVC